VISNAPKRFKRTSEFSLFWRTWMLTSGRDEASRWLAEEVGELAEVVEKLKRRVARMEHQPKRKIQKT